MNRWFAFFFVLFLGISPAAQAGGFGLQSLNAYIGGVAGYNVKNGNVPYSPILGAGMEIGSKRVALYFDLHSLPFFTGEGPDCLLTSSTVCDSGNSRSFLMSTLGLTMGNKIVRVGPYITGGYKGFSTGARLVMTPKGGPKIGWHGFEFRLGYYLKNCLYSGLMYKWRWTGFGPKGR